MTHRDGLQTCLSSLGVKVFLGQGWFAKVWPMINKSGLGQNAVWAKSGLAQKWSGHKWSLSPLCAKMAQCQSKFPWCAKVANVWCPQQRGQVSVEVGESLAEARICEPSIFVFGQKAGSGPGGASCGWTNVRRGCVV